MVLQSDCPSIPQLTVFLGVGWGTELGGVTLSSFLAAMVMVTQTPPRDELLPLEEERLTVHTRTAEIFSVILTTW